MTDSGVSETKVACPSSVILTNVSSEPPSSDVSALIRLVELAPEWKEVDWTTMRGAMDGVRIAMVVINGEAVDGGDKHEAVVAIVRKAQSIMPYLAIWDTLIPLLDDFIAAQKTMLNTDLNSTQRIAIAAASATCSAVTRRVCGGSNVRKQDRKLAFPRACNPKRRTAIPSSVAFRKETGRE